MYSKNFITDIMTIETLGLDHWVMMILLLLINVPTQFWLPLGVTMKPYLLNKCVKLWACLIGALL